MKLNHYLGFARWAEANRDELLKLGPGAHFGEWYGSGIQRGYGLKEKRFALFNSTRWAEARPACCDVVPILYSGIMSESAIEQAMERLRAEGSVISPGFMRPEGVVIYHMASQSMFKRTLERDEEPKGMAA